jgi:hypothetical protein
MNLVKRYIFWTEERGSLHYDDVVQSRAGPMKVEQYSAVHDGKGTVVAYDAVARRANP